MEVVGEERKERFRRGGRGFKFGEERGFGGGGHYCERERERERGREKRGLRERKGLGEN